MNLHCTPSTAQNIPCQVMQRLMNTRAPLTYLQLQALALGDAEEHGGHRLGRSARSACSSSRRQGGHDEAIVMQGMLTPLHTQDKAGSAGAQRVTVAHRAALRMRAAAAAAWRRTPCTGCPGLAGCCCGSGSDARRFAGSRPSVSSSPSTGDEHRSSTIGCSLSPSAACPLAAGVTAAVPVACLPVLTERLREAAAVGPRVTPEAG